jgi:hypothetical protein
VPLVNWPSLGIIDVPEGIDFGKVRDAAKRFYDQTINGTSQAMRALNIPPAPIVQNPGESPRDFNIRRAIEQDSNLAAGVSGTIAWDAPVTHAPTQALIDKAGAKLFKGPLPELWNTSNTLNGSRSVFIGPEGHLLDIGDAMHWSALQNARLAGGDLGAGIRGINEADQLGDALRQHQLVRGHIYNGQRTGREVAFHIMHEPTAAQLDTMEQLTNQMRPGENISYDLRMPNAQPAQGLVQRARDFWNAYFNAGK